MIRLLAVVVVALVLAPAALACNPHPTLAAMEGQIMCPVCGTTLDQSDSAAAAQIENVISRRIAAGDSDCQIKDLLVQQYGDAILAAPPRHGLGLLAWWLPIAGLLVGLAAVTVGVWQWSRTRDPDEAEAAPGEAGLEPELERRVDEELARLDA